jgi:hypothetical protein
VKSGKWLCIGLLLALSVGLGFSPVQAQDTGKKLALLVGIDRYPSGSGFSSLPFPQRDVDELAKLLIESGYRPEHVRVLTREKGFNEGTESRHPEKGTESRHPEKGLRD